MRKITQQAIDAFMSGKEFSRDNTKVHIHQDASLAMLTLHGNIIATRNYAIEKISITHAGWQTATTKERLNGIPGVKINQKAGKWFLNDKEWKGDWITI